MPRLASTPPWSLYTSWQRCAFLAVLFLVTTSSYFDYFVLSVVLEPIKHEFRVSDTMLGMLSGLCFALLYALSALPIARWSDRGNRSVVITVALTGWSVTTALCGVAQSFWQLAAARLGTGLMQPGAVPPAQSLVADYFPPHRLATASALLNAGSAAGNLFGVGVGGYLAAVYGWRFAFLVAGTSGLALVAIVRLVLPEPRSQIGYSNGDPRSETISDAFRQLRRKRSFLWALTGISVYTVYAFGVGTFLPSFMIRSLNATLKEVSLLWGSAITVASLLGALAGGALTDYLARIDVRWYAWTPSCACALGAPLYWIALGSHHLWSFIAIDFVAESLLAIGISVSFATVHAVCGSSRRAMAIAIVQLSFVLLGSGLGPLMAGALSDTFQGAYGVHSLRYSLIAMVAFLVPAAAAFYRAGLAIPAELERTSTVKACPEGSEANCHDARA